MTGARENYLLAARGERPYWVPSFTEDSNTFMPDFWSALDPDTGADFMNVKWVENEFGKMPREDWRAMEDIGRWRDFAKFPDLSTLDWEGMVARARQAHAPDKVNMALLNTYGIFLIPVNMLGWVDALCAIYTDREELEAFVSAITDFLVETARYIGRYFKPDIIVTGDDFAAASGPFLAREVFAGLYKPYLRKIIDACKAQGALVEFHCCGNCGYLIGEFLDLGVDICQLPMPNDALVGDKKKYGGRLVLTGGWDRRGPGAVPGAPEHAVRQSVRTAIDTYGRDGALIFWDGGICGQSADARQKLAWVSDELHTYGQEIYRR
ncbi:Uroporphyrinogen decarboxylase (URO-D) [Sporobacter termitidis DSM 10068]|uniref:Uroporphyrinogen decarboxylase (URO-D) n=1 Tax=Sporobacter termitidis DSM 10068 TaxID=1123282 RepID=A0A1M5WGV5_9FIRM|nr:uroporphyrinogen decarboxylase family protein [Sporobacter termitidis]SHH86742.1 Uroporphyrinogen decarboxylase (URO-D) [Sporobacter termitidis DSM 10068]